MTRVKELMNGKALRKQLGISTTIFYRLKKNGMPYHQFPGGRAYYVFDEVIDWLLKSGFHQDNTWTNK